MILDVGNGERRYADLNIHVQQGCLIDIEWVLV